MRNWNGFPAFVSPTSAEFSAYLWGIETQHSQKVWRCAEWVFSVPMRNWNFFSFLILLLISAGFQRTYEELKLPGPPSTAPPVPVFSVPMRNWNKRKDPLNAISSKSFQRTYEELKLPVHKDILIQEPSFQRTYEELKPQQRLNIMGTAWVFSVPMRNWN